MAFDGDSWMVGLNISGGLSFSCKVNVEAGGDGGVLMTKEADWCNLRITVLYHRMRHRGT
jgi:hypothetical protein